jgi:DNA-directed RNA polymerase specialized sigma24 family protein
MHFNGYKYDEIAQRMDIPLGTVKAVSSSPERKWWRD